MLFSYHLFGTLHNQLFLTKSLNIIFVIKANRHIKSFKIVISKIQKKRQIVELVKPWKYTYNYKSNCYQRICLDLIGTSIKCTMKRDSPYQASLLNQY